MPVMISSLSVSRSIADSNSRPITSKRRALSWRCGVSSYKIAPSAVPNQEKTALLAEWRW